MNQEAESELIRHEACSQCGSSDASAYYTDGHSYCFSCQAYTGGTNVQQTVEPLKSDLIQGEHRPLGKRGISLEIAKKFDYQIGTYKGETVHIANYKDASGKTVAQKIRYADKRFKFIGDTKAAQLYGQHLWKDGGKQIVITEGEIDALSMSQALQGKWPVVSISTGAAGARKAIQRQIEWLEKFETVVFMFDMDEPGQQAATECAELLSTGKAKIASLPVKDPNEMLLAGKVKELTYAAWDAKPYRPDGLVQIEDLIEDLSTPIVQGLPWFLDSLTKITFGRREGELYGFGAGTGIGKTDVLTQQIAYDVNELGLKVGLFFLEQKPKESVKRIAGKIAGERYHVPDGSWEQEAMINAVKDLQGKVVLYDSFGQTDWLVIKNKIRYMAHAESIKLFYVDHLTAMADTADERGSLEQIMKEMAGLANELSIIIHFVSHLATPDGKPHEEGGQVSIRHFKGARAIGFWSYFMFGLERNQQAEDPIERQTTTLRVLKDRYTGQATGSLIYLGYNPETTRLYETTKPSTEGEVTAEDYF